MSVIPENIRIIVRGAGELASGTIRRLSLAGFQVIALEKANPECVRRNVCFAEAIFEGEKDVEGVAAVYIENKSRVDEILKTGKIPLLIDPDAGILSDEHDVLIDARMMKRDIDTSIDTAEIVIGLGPGFTAGVNCHAVVETNRGNELGRVIYDGKAQADTGIPAVTGGYGAERVLRAPANGIFQAKANIGDQVEAGDEVGVVSDQSVRCKIGGILRGLIRGGIEVRHNQKIGDIDPSGIVENCYRVSDKANAVAGGVLEGVFSLLNGRRK